VCVCVCVQPQDIQKSVLKGIINSLLREWKGWDSLICLLVMQLLICYESSSRVFGRSDNRRAMGMIVELGSVSLPLVWQLLRCVCSVFQASDQRRPSSLFHPCSGEAETSADAVKAEHRSTLPRINNQYLNSWLLITRIKKGLHLSFFILFDPIFRSLSHSLSFSLSLSLTFSHSLSLSRSLTLSRSLWLSLSHSLSHFLLLSLALIFTLSLSLSYLLSLQSDSPFIWFWGLESDKNNNLQ